MLLHVSIKIDFYGLRPLFMTYVSEFLMTRWLFKKITLKVSNLIKPVYIKLIHILTFIKKRFLWNKTLLLRSIYQISFVQDANDVILVKLVKSPNRLLNQHNYDYM